ncbi:hypothetical protein Noda2021_07120 [Candidatus Dependentiae bacterium Noda2021]|nr:hypothetical protein Noda2021_07120 [Candidatus Dependentiae bacterium Noda2021]
MKQTVTLFAPIGAFILGLLLVPCAIYSDSTPWNYFSEKPCNGYVFLDESLRDATVPSRTASHESVALKAIVGCIDDNVLVVPSDLIKQALIDLTLVTPERHDELLSVVAKIDACDPELVIDLETARKRCKRFNKLCVRGNVLICGNLTVCCNAPNIVCDPGAGLKGQPEQRVQQEIQVLQDLRVIQARWVRVAYRELLAIPVLMGKQVVQDLPE